MNIEKMKTMNDEKLTLEEYLYSQGNLDPDEVSIVADEVRAIVANEIADILDGEPPANVFKGDPEWVRGAFIDFCSVIAKSLRYYPDEYMPD